MTTLTDHWTSTLVDLDAALAVTRADLTDRRQALSTAQATQRAQNDVVRAASDLVAAARKALAGIPMPADGDPLLVQMSKALVEWRQAQAAAVRAELAQQAVRADLAWLEAREARLQAELTQAKAVLGRIEREATDRQKAADALTTGPWANLAVDATQALTDVEATARARVEGEFPSSATQSKDFLRRVRARKALVTASAAHAVEVEALAFTASHDALALAQRQFDQAWQAVRGVLEAAPRLKDDRALLARLAALPAPQPATATDPARYPIVTPAQHDTLFNPTLKTVRENALAKLKTADDADAAARTAQATYDKALQAAIKAHPHKTRTELDATVVAAELGTLTGKQDELKAARKALEVDDLEGYKALQAWFAAVPDALWEALDQLDATVAQLTALKSPPTPATLLADLAAREADLVTALSAARLAQRTEVAAREAAQRAAALLQAEQATAAAHALAVSRGTATL